MPTLRQAAKDDITLIHELACQAFPATYRDLLSREQIDFMMDWMYSPANLEKQMEEGHVYFIASHEGKDCGYLVRPAGRPRRLPFAENLRSARASRACI